MDLPTQSSQLTSPQANTQQKPPFRIRTDLSVEWVSPEVMRKLEQQNQKVRSRKRNPINNSETHSETHSKPHSKPTSTCTVV
jgi:hypothetical protein